MSCYEDGMIPVYGTGSLSKIFDKLPVLSIVKAVPA